MSALLQGKNAHTQESAQCVAEKEMAKKETNENSEKDTAVISYPREPLRKTEDPRAYYARLDRLAYRQRVLRGARICALREIRQTERELLAVIDEKQTEQKEAAGKRLTAKDKKRLKQKDEKRRRIAEKKIEEASLLKQALCSCEASAVAMEDETARIEIRVSAALAETAPGAEEKRLPRRMQLKALRARAERGIYRTARKYVTLERVLESGRAGRRQKTEKKLRRQLIQGESLLHAQKLLLMRLDAAIAAASVGDKRQ